MQAPRPLLALLLISSTAALDRSKGGRVSLRRMVLVLLVVGIVLDLMISAVLLYNNHQIRAQASETHIVKVAAYEACLSSNANRAVDLGRWEKVLALVDTMPQNQAVVRFVQGVRAANATADHPTDCGPLRP